MSFASHSRLSYFSFLCGPLRGTSALSAVDSIATIGKTAEEKPRNSQRIAEKINLGTYLVQRPSRRNRKTELPKTASGARLRCSAKNLPRSGSLMPAVLPKFAGMVDPFG